MEREEYRHYEPSKPITQEELYERVKNITVDELNKSGFRYEGNEPCSNSLRLALVRHNGEFVIRHPDEKPPITIFYPKGGSQQYEYVKKELESLLKIPIKEIQSVEAVSA